MKIAKYPSPELLESLLQRPEVEWKSLSEKVNGIIDEVRQNGDTALRKFTRQFDGVELTELSVSNEEFDNAAKLVPTQLKEAMQIAARNIEIFHEAQRPNFKSVTTMPGVTCWRKAVPIEKVGLYVPGGTAPLFSTVLMLAIPARLAGCGEIVLLTPPGKDGTVFPAILYATQLAGITRVIKVGGAQAIAAMAFGTETVPKVDKIFGPGNRYVTAAKMLVQKDGIAIDMPAGPSEVLVFADETARPDFVASDLLSQAEHDADAQTIIITTSDALLDKVQKELAVQSNVLPRQEMLQKALSHSVGILVESCEQALDAINLYAPEHLILASENAEEMAELVKHAGSVFIGNFSPESAGDYASGTNHTLPTNGFAKSYSGVSLDSFFRYITFQQISPKGLKALAPAIISMAEAEQLPAHAAAVRLRLNHLKR